MSDLVEIIYDYELTPHPIANIFPMMCQDDYEALKADIKENGLVQPIHVFEGDILDGRNRYKACLELGIKPVLVTYRGEKPIEYAISLNEKRRHLNAGQRACVAVDALPVYEAEAKKKQVSAGGDKKSDDYQKSLSQLIEQPIFDSNENKSNAQASKAFNTNRQYVADAKCLKTENPYLFEQVKNGEITLSRAVRYMRLEIIHEYNLIFPWLPDTQMAELVTDIKELGLLEPITLLDGMILDGKIRYMACLAAGIKPRYVEYVGDNPVAFVKGKNLIRKNFSPKAVELINSLLKAAQEAA